MSSFPEGIQQATERLISWHLRRLRRRAGGRYRIAIPLEWLLSFLGAVAVILVVNQYLFQFYVIPSGSMMDTLLVHDRISVSKLAYGVEPLPGLPKLSEGNNPKRGDIVTFRNPDYRSRGPLFDIAQRFVFMATFSLVNLDRDRSGRPAAHYLIKRVVALGGDRVRIDPVDGSMEIAPEGIGVWLPERDFKQLAGVTYRTVRLFRAPDYARLQAATTAYVYYRAGLPVPRPDLIAVDGMPSRYDLKVFEYDGDRIEYAIHPEERAAGSRWRRFALGWYIAPGELFPMGDNRDDSRDGRYFGPVPLSLVRGKATFRFWPPGRAGMLR